jgi:endoglucanase
VRVGEDRFAISAEHKSTSSADFERMRSWGSNVVRLPMYQRYWLRDVTLEGITYGRQAYRDLIAATVQRANAAGLTVLVDLHASDRGDPDFPDDVADIQQMADVNHSVPFSREVARQFRGNGRVIFQLYNEPNQIDWELWRNGGLVPEGETFPPQSSGVAFQAAGMQALYDAVRGEGAENLVIVNGVHWGYDLSLPEYALDGHNIVYATHPYDYPDKQANDWDRAFGFLAATHPVMIAEFVDYVCNRNGYYTQVLDYADRLNLSWIAWAWWAPPADRPDLICGFPTLIEDWSGTPSPTGAVVRERLGRY